MKLTSHAAPRLVAAAITCTAIVLPAAALAAAGSAATAGSPASAARPAHPVTAYVILNGADAGTVTTISDTTSAVTVAAAPATCHLSNNTSQLLPHQSRLST